jgi:membrane protease YdiL (CAAX protease family)
VTARTGAPLSHVLLYFVLACAISWAWVIPLAATGHTVAQGRGWPTHFPSLVGPMVAALLVTAWDAGGPGVRDLLARMARWRIGWQWWVTAVSPLLVFLAVLVVLAVAGADVPAGKEFADFSGISSGLGVLAVWSVILLVNGLGEETGWRGYALAQLQRRWSPVTAAFLVAAGWAVWHIPQFFLLQSYQDFSAPMIPVFLIGLAGGSVVLTWLYNPQPEQHPRGRGLARALQRDRRDRRRVDDVRIAPGGHLDLRRCARSGAARAGTARAHGRPAQRHRPAQIRVRRPGPPMTADRCLVI